jgi:hypothetical protein
MTYRLSTPDSVFRLHSSRWPLRRGLQSLHSNLHQLSGIVPALMRFFAFVFLLFVIALNLDTLNVYALRDTGV